MIYYLKAAVFCLFYRASEGRRRDRLRRMRSREHRSFSRSRSREASDKDDSLNEKEKRQEEKPVDKNCEDGEKIRDVDFKESDAKTKLEFQGTERNKDQTGEEKDKEKEKDKQTETPKKDRGGSRKTLDLISKLQEKKDDKKETEKKELESKRGENSRTKGLISKLQANKEAEEKEKREKERDVERKREQKNESRTKGLVSKMEDAKNQTDTGKVGERRNRQTWRDTWKERKKETELRKGTNNEKDVTRKAETRNRENCTSGDDQSTKTEDDDDDGDDCLDSDTGSSMFDDLLEQVRNNDPELTELNINNSDVIKNDTLIQFATGLRSNTHIKTFALANTRADDHVAFAIAGTLRGNATLTEINLDSNHLTGKGILAIIESLQHNATLTQLRFHNQRHILGGKTEMEMTKVLRDNTSLLKLGYHFELAGPRMTMTNILSRNMDRQRQKRLEAQRLAKQDTQPSSAQAQTKVQKKKELLPETPKPKGTPSSKPNHVEKKESILAKVSKFNNPATDPKTTQSKHSPGHVPSNTPGKKGGVKKAESSPGPPPPPSAPAPPPPPAPGLDVQALRRSLNPVSQRKADSGRVSGRGSERSSRDQLLDSIRNCSVNTLKKGWIWRCCRTWYSIC
uniref:Leiomodin-3 n=1 Tax=Astyanax mexicanus TaxID=7994 RepID=A0A8B9GR76_ASTMX